MDDSDTPGQDVDAIKSIWSLTAFSISKVLLIDLTFQIELCKPHILPLRVRENK
jgi:hypothetical protein